MPGLFPLKKNLDDSLHSSQKRIAEDLFPISLLLIFLLSFLWQELNLNQGISLLQKLNGGDLERKQRPDWNLLICA